MADEERNGEAGSGRFAGRLRSIVEGPLLVHIAVYWPMYLAIVYCTACLMGASMEDYLPDDLRQADMLLKNTLIFFDVKKYAAERVFAYHASLLIFPPGWVFVLVSTFISRRRLREEFNKKTHSFFEGKVFACFCVGTCCALYLVFGLEFKSRSRLSFLLFSDTFISFSWYLSFLLVCYSVVAQFILSIYGWKVTSWKTKVHHG